MAGTAAAPRLPDGDELVAFIEACARVDLRFDGRQLANAMGLLARAQLAPADSVECTRFWTRLVPVLATSGPDSRVLYALIEQWFGEGDAVRDLSPGPLGAVSETVPSVPDPPSRPAAGNRMRGRLVAIVLILAVGAAALALSWMRPVADISNDKISPSPTPTRHIDYEKVVTKQQVTKFSVETVRADEESKQVRLILLVSSLIVVLAIGLLAYMEWRRRRKRLIRYASLRRRGSDQSLALSAEPFDAQFASKEFREAAQRLRLPIRIPTHDLDVPRTLRATLAAGGAFSLVERQRKQLPEYLALIERRSAHDHLYQLYRLAVDRLRAAGVDIRSYSFGNNPLLLSEDIGADGTGPIVHLETLSALAAGQRVLVFGPSSVLLTPHSRQAPAWLTQFQPWEERALLDSRGYSLGDKGELDLVQAGWLVGLARPESLAALADRVASGRTGGGWLE